MVIAIAIAGSGEAVRGEVGSQLKGLLGDAGAQATQLEEPYRQALAAKDTVLIDVKIEKNCPAPRLQ